MSESVVRVPLSNAACAAIMDTAVYGPCMLVWCRTAERRGDGLWRLFLNRTGSDALREVIAGDPPGDELVSFLSPDIVRDAVSRMLSSPSRGFRRIAAAALVDVGDVDAAMADVIVQHAVFGDDAPFG